MRSRVFVMATNGLMQTLMMIVIIVIIIMLDVNFAWLVVCA